MTRQEWWKTGMAGRAITKRDLQRLRRVELELFDLPATVHSLHPQETAVPPSVDDDPARVRVIEEMRRKYASRSLLRGDLSARS